MITYAEIENRLTRMGRVDLLESSAVRRDDIFTNILSTIRPVPESIIEIGTYRGIATLVLASMAEKVYTFDVVYQQIADVLWEAWGVRDKIEYIVIDAYRDGYDINSLKKLGIHELVRKGIDHTIANKLIDRYLKNNNVSADLVFIDGKHQRDQIEKDYNITRKFKRILFHDIAENYPGVADFMKEIGAKIINGFGYYENTSDK